MAIYNTLFPATSFLTAQEAINALSRCAGLYPIPARSTDFVRKEVGASLPGQVPKFESKTGKFWSTIIDEYDFFSAHSSEADVLSAVYASTIDHYPHANPALLDFGSGNSSFTTSVIRLLKTKPGRISLFEPTGEYHEEALKNMAGVIQDEVRTYTRFEEMDNNVDVDFDIILANHSLYYVDDPIQSMLALLARLREQGMIIATLADPVLNPLLVLWYEAFSSLGRPVPFYVPEEIFQAIGYLGLMVKINRVESKLFFPDTPINRKKIFKFVLGQYACLFEDRYIDDFFDPFSHEDNVNIPLVDDHLIIVRAGQ